MMKHEFDSLAGVITTLDEYTQIEYVYMNSPRFEKKEDIVAFYKEHGMGGIEGIFYNLSVIVISEEGFKQYISDLATFAEGYVVEIKKHLSKISIPTFQNKTVVKLLSEYAIRLEKERQQLLKDFMSNTITRNESVSFSNNVLTNSSHYKTVLYGILIEEWQQSQKQKSIPTC